MTALWILSPSQLPKGAEAVGPVDGVIKVGRLNQFLVNHSLPTKHKIKRLGMQRSGVKCRSMAKPPASQRCTL